MEQLSRARPCGCQDMGQIAWTGFQSSWPSRYAGETCQARRSIQTGHGPVPRESVLERFSTRSPERSPGAALAPTATESRGVVHLLREDSEAGTTGGLY